jgi:hypothetical protein
MKVSEVNTQKFLPVSLLFFIVFLLMCGNANATAQWAKKFSLSCNTCHTVFPRLNTFGEEFLANGYQLESTYKKNWEDQYSINAGGVFLDDLQNLFGVRINLTPFMLETNSFQKDSASEKTSKLTFGNPNWIQFFAAGSIFKDISFFSEMEFTQGAFHFSWFYFNFTNLADSKLLNFQLGNLSPLQFAAYPNRLRMIAAIRSEAMRIRTSNGNGEASVDMSGARKGLQYYGRVEWVTIYAGFSPGFNSASVGQTLGYWGGATLKLPESVSRDFAGTSFTVHYYGGTDTKGTGSAKQIENKYTRISPQVAIRYKDIFDIQAAYIIGNEDNWNLVPSPTEDFTFNGIGITGRYFISSEWSCGLQYDQYASDEDASGTRVLNYNRLTPALTYVINGNISLTALYEANLRDPEDEKVNKFYLNMRAMF